MSAVRRAAVRRVAGIAVLTRCGHGIDVREACAEGRRIDALRRGEDAPFVEVEPVRRRESRWPEFLRGLTSFAHGGGER